MAVARAPRVLDMRCVLAERICVSLTSHTKLPHLHIERQSFVMKTHRAIIYEPRDPA